MSSETFVSAMLLITGVVAAAILIVAVLPVIWGMVGTFSSASAATDRSMRTDFKIVTTYARYSSTIPAGANVTVWMKNTGDERISFPQINSSAEVYVGKFDNFGRANWYLAAQPKQNLRWSYVFFEPSATQLNGYWDPGETIQVDTYTTSITASGQVVYFQFTLPGGISRSAQFTVMAV